MIKYILNNLLGFDSFYLTVFYLIRIEFNNDVFTSGEDSLASSGGSEPGGTQHDHHGEYGGGDSQKLQKHTYYKVQKSLRTT